MERHWETHRSLNVIAASPNTRCRIVYAQRPVRAVCLAERQLLKPGDDDDDDDDDGALPLSSPKLTHLGR